MAQNDFKLNFESFQQLLLEMAQQRSVDDLLHLVTSSLVSNRNVALARVWMVGAGRHLRDLRGIYGMPDQSRCLHLTASRGLSTDNVTTWDATEHSNYRRFPIGVRKVGRIAATGQPGYVSAINGNSDWIADKSWTERGRHRQFRWPATHLQGRGARRAGNVYEGLPGRGLPRAHAA